MGKLKAFFSIWSIVLVDQCGRKMVLFIDCISRVPNIHQKRSGFCCVRSWKYMRKNVLRSKRTCSLCSEKRKRQKRSADGRVQNNEEINVVLSYPHHKKQVGINFSFMATQCLKMCRPALLADGVWWWNELPEEPPTNPRYSHSLGPQPNLLFLTDPYNSRSTSASQKQQLKTLRFYNIFIKITEFMSSSSFSTCLQSL